MTKKSSQNYSYAYNSNNELINVSIAQRCNNYFCPICGELMIPHMGNKRRWHFVHKNIGNCSYESYLHKLAKFKIKQAFLTSEHFLLSYNAKAICSIDCPFIDSPKCKGEKFVEFDLRKFYDACDIEAKYNNYRADLLLSSSKNSKLPPVLIEIMVSHKCSNDKIQDGVRIIEIPIQSEDQIENIVNSCSLKGIRYNSFDFRFSKERVITLYNFNKIELFDPVGMFDEDLENYNRKNTIVFLLDKTGLFRKFDCHCYEVKEKVPSNVHYYITEIATPFKEIFQGFSKRGVKIKNCFLCRFSQHNSWGDRLCVLYKKHNLPRKPSPLFAKSCPHYREDFNINQNAVETFRSNSLEQEDDSPVFKFHYHICKDIL